MKKKRILLTLIAVALLICCIAFFKPLSISDLLTESDEISIILSEFRIENGTPYIDSVDYQNITEEQRSAILTTAGNYTYRRTIGTPFSDGSMSDIGSKALYLYVYDDASLVGNIVIASSGEIAVNDKTYRMKNAEKLIEQITFIVE